MPRELGLVSPRAMRMADLVEAGSAVDGSLVLRSLNRGGSLQLVDESDCAVLTIDISRQVHEVVDLVLVVGPIPSTDEVWWTSATAPWGETGRTGVRVAEALAVLLHALLHVDAG